MSIDASPPPNPPMLSPDGRWFWDGTQWQPIATETEAGHLGVFPEWNASHVDAAAAAPPAQQVQVTIPSPAAGIQYGPAQASPLDYTAGGAVTPLWRRERRSKLSLPMYVAGGAIALVVSVAFLGFMAQRVSWPWSSNSPDSSPTPTATASPLTTRSDFARADLFFTGQLTPAIESMSKAHGVLMISCGGALTNTCQNAITDTDAQLKNALSVIDRAAIPACIASAVARTRSDLAGMENGLQIALKAFADNSRNELVSGMAGYKAYDKPLPGDFAAIGAARTAVCDTRLVGP